MKTWLVVTVIAFLVVSHAKGQFLEYDAVAIQRFKDEFRRLGVSPPAVTDPQKPVTKPVPPPRVSSPAGDFEGFWTSSQFKRPIAAFEGIPYVKPPVGPLRFKLAQPLPRFPDRFKATKLGGACMQPAGGTEDCLYLNIYVPEKVERSKKELLPVVFEVHGGGFVIGAASSRPGMILEKDVVFVTFNYRLGPLGFLTTEDGVIPANLGMKDQVAALNWTVNNIASFGGNPKLITVTGISAGGASTEFLMLSPLTKGLMHRAMPMSGSSYSPWALSPPGEMRRNVRRAAELLKCPAKPSSALLACLQTKSGAEITHLATQYAAWKQSLTVAFKIVVEGNVPGALLPEHPSKMFANRSNDVPVVTGVVSEEGSLFGLIHLFNSPDVKKFDKEFASLAPPLLELTGSSETIRATAESLRRAYFGPGPFNVSHTLLASKLFGDVHFLLPAIRSVQSHWKGAESPIYLYYFNYKSSRDSNSLDDSKGFGVDHGGDGPYCLYPLPGATNPMDVKMALIYTELLWNFARDGVPSTNLVNVTWSPVSSPDKDMEYLNIYSPLDIKLKKNLLPERWSLLETLLEEDSL